MKSILITGAPNSGLNLAREIVGQLDFNIKQAVHVNDYMSNLYETCMADPNGIKTFPNYVTFRQNWNNGSFMDAVEQDFPAPEQHKSAVLTDFRFMRALPFIHALLPKDSIYIVMVRNPSEAAKSTAAKYGVSYSDMVWAWRSHYEDLATFAYNPNFIFMDFETLFTRPDVLVSRLSVLDDSFDVHTGKERASLIVKSDKPKFRLQAEAIPAIVQGMHRQLQGHCIYQ